MTHKDYAEVTDREAFIKEHRDLGLFFECAEEVLKEDDAGKKWFSKLPKGCVRQPSLLNTQEKWKWEPMISRLWNDLKERLEEKGVNVGRFKNYDDFLTADFCKWFVEAPPEITCERLRDICETFKYYFSGPKGRHYLIKNTDSKMDRLKMTNRKHIDLRGLKEDCAKLQVLVGESGSGKTHEMISRNVNGFTVWLTAGEEWNEKFRIQEKSAEKRAEFQDWVWDQIRGEILALARHGGMNTKEVPEKLMKDEKKVVVAFDEMSSAKNTLYLLCRYHSSLYDFLSGKLGCPVVEILAGGTGADGTARSAGSNPQNYTVTRLTRIFGKENVPTLIETIRPDMVPACSRFLDHPDVEDLGSNARAAVLLVLRLKDYWENLKSTHLLKDKDEYRLKEKEWKKEEERQKGLQERIEKALAAAAPSLCLEATKDFTKLNGLDKLTFDEMVKWSQWAVRFCRFNFVRCVADIPNYEEKLDKIICTYGLVVDEGKAVTEITDETKYVYIPHKGSDKWFTEREKGKPCVSMQPAMRFMITRRFGFEEVLHGSASWEALEGTVAQSLAFAASCTDSVRDFLDMVLPPRSKESSEGNSKSKGKNEAGINDSSEKRWADSDKDTVMLYHPEKRLAPGNRPTGGVHERELMPEVVRKLLKGRISGYIEKHRVMVALNATGASYSDVIVAGKGLWMLIQAKFTKTEEKRIASKCWVDEIAKMRDAGKATKEKREPSDVTSAQEKWTDLTDAFSYLTGVKSPLMVFYLCGYDDPVEVAKQRKEKAYADVEKWKKNHPDEMKAVADVEQKNTAELMKKEAEKAREELEILTSTDVVFITDKDPDALLPRRWPSKGSSLDELIFTDRRADRRN